MFKLNQNTTSIWVNQLYQALGVRIVIFIQRGWDIFALCRQLGFFKFF